MSRYFYQWKLLDEFFLHDVEFGEEGATVEKARELLAEEQGCALEQLAVWSVTEGYLSDLNTLLTSPEQRELFRHQ